METILIMIVVGVISMIFRKTKNNQGQSIRKPFGNRLGDIQTMIKDITDIPKDTMAKQTENKQGLLQSNQGKLEKEYLQVRQESEAGRMGMAVARTQTANEGPIKNQEEIKFTIAENPDPRTVITGIIWSEILAEPRSKNPYTVKKRSS
ncbi:hypothetical protein M3226_05595 [Neobacillus cucumis]|uniref:hypothetical protein n=1 Tax=Neobacillus cucumis TaxID=1740721 RepID=UPI002040727F|nr:hypothetical protein [Neobacillus cucumis]MCM3725173.1 hypothetical protein [Neobacillus cucumis]